MHSSGSMTRMRSAWWMQSTGQTSTHERSLMSMQGSAMMYVTGRSAAYSTQALDLGSQLLDELRGALLQRVLDHDLVEARLVCAPQPGRVGVAAEAEDRHVRIEIRDLLRLDAGDVGDAEVGPVGAVGRHEPMLRQERIPLAPGERVDTTEQQRRPGERV